MRLPSLLLAFALLPAHDAWAQRPVDRLSWMSGCWHLTSRDRVVEEQWMVPRGGAMLGVGRTVRGADVLEYEFLRIYTSGDTLIYASRPSGQEPAEFRAKSVGVQDIVFENLKHDFPQRIIYRMTGKDSMLARVEGERRGQLRGSDFPYARVACGSAGPAPGGTAMAPGAMLKPGTSIIYLAGPSEAFWTIDSVARDTTLGARTHCVRIRLRLSHDQAVPGTRAYCRDAMMLYSWNDSTRTHTAIRPLSAGGVLDVNGPNGMTVRYETAAATMERISGHQVEVIPTVVTTRDSAGKVVRRLRERFSVGLATATGGVFEVPDATQPDGWKMQTRFEIAALRP